MPPYNRDFKLVQRVELIVPAVGPQELICEYMGSSEFEFGVIPAARRRLEAYDTLVTVRHPITLDGKTKDVFFLGDAATIQEKIVSMQEWVGNGLLSKEHTGFEDYFRGCGWDGEPLPEWYRTRVWWALNIDLLWAMEEQWLIAFATQRELRPTPFAGF